MKEFKGTPGPWDAAGLCFDAVGTENDGMSYKPICHRPVYTGGKLTEEYNANMRLIAAAPELLEALQHVLSVWVDEDMADITEAEEESLIQARAAIAKALGETK